MGVRYTIKSLKDDLTIEVGFFIDQLKKSWLNVQVHQPTDPRAHSPLQWSFDTDCGGSIGGDLYANGIGFHVYENKSIGTFARWVRTIIPPDVELVLYNNDLSHHPITLHNTITDDEIEQGFNIPFDASRYE